MHTEPDTTPRSKIPADVDTPDKIVYGLTARQLAIFTIAAVVDYGLFKALSQLLPQPLVVALLIPIAAVAIVLALGRRDGLTMDVWLLSAVRHTRTPRRLAPAADGKTAVVPDWSPQTTPVVAPAVLRLPAHAIGADGIVDTGSRAVALIGCTTVNINLRTGDEQAALIGGFGRWLNGLGGPVQVVISAQRVDLSGHAQRIADTADTIANPALAEAAADYADFLDDLAVRRDPLWRTVTVAVTATGERASHDVARRAEHTASALSGLGVQTAVLDGERVTAVLATAVDPYTPSDASWPRSRPDAVIHAKDSHHG